MISMTRAWAIEKSLSSRQDLNQWPPKHRAGALSTWATWAWELMENKWLSLRARNQWSDQNLNDKSVVPRLGTSRVHFVLFTDIIWKPIETSLCNVNDNSFSGPLVIGIFRKRPPWPVPGFSHRLKRHPRYRQWTICFLWCRVVTFS